VGQLHAISCGEDVTPTPAPGGPYRLYIDPDSNRLHACAFNAPEGEEIVVFGDQAKADGYDLPRTTSSIRRPTCRSRPDARRLDLRPPLRRQ
jgi:hypothetical protein